MSSFIGIDLGTTYSAVATIDETGRPMIVHNQDGQNITPSCVSIEDGTVVVGESARRTWGVSEGKAAARFKREMGTNKTFMVEGDEFSPTDLSALVLKKLLQDTKESIGEIGEAVVTIPANFSNEARDQTMAAAKSVGLNVNYIINEPTAAALYYAFKNGEDLHGNYAVYDMGGGTFDISIIRVDGQNVDVVATNGVSKLGGDDFDVCLQKLIANKFKDATGEEMEAEDFSKNDAEEQKKSLSKREKVTVKVMRQLVDVTREEFEEAISSKVTQAQILCEATLDEAGLSPSDIRNVLLAGGSTRVPLVKESIKKVFGQEGLSSVNVDEVVALGAALYAAYKGDQSRLSAAQKSAIQKIKVSESSSQCFGTIAVYYDEEREQEKLINTVLIHKGEKIPFSVTKSFYTMHKGQTEVACRLTESTSNETNPNFVKVLWEDNLILPEGRESGQEIRVTYSYDDNQMVNMSYLDVASGEVAKGQVNVSSSVVAEESDINKFVVE